jgi:hypothetical protein
MLSIRYGCNDFMRFICMLKLVFIACIFILFFEESFHFICIGNWKRFINRQMTTKFFYSALILDCALIGESGWIKPSFCGCYWNLRQCAQRGWNKWLGWPGIVSNLTVYCFTAIDFFLELEISGKCETHAFARFTFYFDFIALNYRMMWELPLNCLTWILQLLF